MEGFFLSIFGYARISAKEQHADRQIIALQIFGVDQIFTDRQSGKDFNRPQYKRLLRRMKATDVLVVKSIDRLGRNYADILNQWRIITKDKDAAILDTRRDRDIFGTLIADLVLQIMSAFAQIERDFIRQRQAEGIAAAKARGVRFGCKPLPHPDNYPEVYALWKDGKISARKAAKLLGDSHFPFIRWTKIDLKSNFASRNVL